MSSNLMFENINRRKETRHFQQALVSPHYFLNARETVNGGFLGCWIGRNGPVLCPPRSIDQYMDIVSRGYVKNIVYAVIRAI